MTDHLTHITHEQPVQSDTRGTHIPDVYPPAMYPSTAKFRRIVIIYRVPR
ncbi:hypothetical protein LPH50_09365 [Xylella taiwanensis]|uniref:Uncharacterized protein n=1 Tax=Xylella taiwanensis TaxID=1444770 RepID=A0ABS8TWP8_9GAMM|nr:hypothetical protein [Xylella taiwanensis]MCD8458556.1 hypothetical protein [Xylella taiwanensis]MCD8460691.1 hypothetical protein [Xylella taiwanensis]MCD8463247.1 hypothetical protein [Xylella taiwanensis]MCD8465196.1 hypothetical protein [Xylella taiwanensis]MCD8467243.1 hypothetical protein [Xylella taiwanensis]